MKLVIIESPFAPQTPLPDDVCTNVRGCFRENRGAVCDACKALYDAVAIRSGMIKGKEVAEELSAWGGLRGEHKIEERRLGGDWGIK